MIFTYRMESTEKCEAIIQHFNGKYIKTPPGVPGEVFEMASYLMMRRPKSFTFIILTKYFPIK